jgi:AcrR family transcriptional regulator
VQVLRDLFAAAIECLRRNGYEQTSVNDIMMAAHVSRRTFYEAFTDRAECFAWVRSTMDAAVLNAPRHAP